jgi:hypothetical protein
VTRRSSPLSRCNCVVQNRTAHNFILDLYIVHHHCNINILINTIPLLHDGEISKTFRRNFRNYNWFYLISSLFARPYTQRYLYMYTHFKLVCTKYLCTALILLALYTWQVNNSLLVPGSSPGQAAHFLILWHWYI